MSYNYITDSHTNAVYKTTSPEGAKLIQRYMNQVGGAVAARRAAVVAKKAAWQAMTLEERKAASRKKGLAERERKRLERRATMEQTPQGRRTLRAEDWYEQQKMPANERFNDLADWDAFVGTRREVGDQYWQRGVEPGRSVAGEFPRPQDVKRRAGKPIERAANRARWRRRGDYSSLTEDEKIAMDKDKEVTELLIRSAAERLALRDTNGGGPRYIEALTRHQQLLHNTDDYKSGLLALEALEAMENASRASQRAWSSSDRAAKSASVAVERASAQQRATAASMASSAAAVALDKEFGPNMQVYNAVHDLTTSRTLARLDSLISAVRNSSLSDPFSKLVSPDFIPESPPIDDDADEDFTALISQADRSLMP